MKYLLIAALMLLLFIKGYAQHEFQVSLKAPAHLNDTLFLSTPDARSGYEQFYTFYLQEGVDVKDFKRETGLSKIITNVYNDLDVIKENIKNHLK